MVLSKLTRLVPVNSNVRVAMLRRMMATAKDAGKGHGHDTHNPDLWKKIFFFVCIPAILISAVNTYLVEKEHGEHYVRPEFRPMEYMYVRKKPFPWGDGNHSLFHNPRVNPLPDGWEEMPELDHGHGKH